MNVFRSGVNKDFLICQMDILGDALTDHYTKNDGQILWLNNNYDEPEEMPVDVFFREEEEITFLETEALNQCRGRILDVGAGVGSHALILQNRGLDVSALELSTGACTIMHSRGVEKIHPINFYSFENERFDTLLFMMNGIGISGTLENLPYLFNHCKKLLNPGGQLLFDSSDISYLYSDIPYPKNKYYGQVSYQYQYKGMKGDWFDWLYIDQSMLKKVSKAAGFVLSILFEDEQDQYLAKLTPNR